MAYERRQELRDDPSFSARLAFNSPDGPVFQLERAIASLVTAGSVVLATAVRSTSLPRAAVLAGAYALATSNWSIASRGVWQHGPSMLALSLAIYLIDFPISNNRGMEKP